MSRGLRESRTEGGGGLRVTIRGEGLWVRSSVQGWVESSNGCGCLGLSVAHETVRESCFGSLMEGHNIWTSVLVREERRERQLSVSMTQDELTKLLGAAS